MREYRSLTLPQMGRRTFLAASFGLLGVCAAAAAGMRMSLTDYNDDPGALDALSYQLTPSTKNIVSLYSAERVLEEMKAEGVDPSSYSLDEARSLLTLPGEDVEGLATVILTGRFTGKRTYVYQAFRSEVEVTEIIGGEGIAAGDLIFVYDPYEIRQPGFFSDSGGIFTDKRVVSATADCHNNGMAPMREGQEYLFFLEKKEFPVEMGVPEGDHLFLLVNHTYPRIPVDVAGHPERIDVIDYSTLETLDHGTWVETVMPEMTFGEACQYDVFVQDQDAADIYRMTSAAILSRVLDG